MPLARKPQEAADTTAQQFPDYERRAKEIESKLTPYQRALAQLHANPEKRRLSRDRVPAPLVKEEEMRTPERQQAVWDAVDQQALTSKQLLRQRRLEKARRTRQNMDEQRRRNADAKLWGGADKYRMVFAPSSKLTEAQRQAAKGAANRAAGGAVAPHSGAICCPPTSNTGGTTGTESVKLVMSNGKLKIQEVRSSKGVGAFIDTVSIVMHDKTLDFYDDIAIDPVSRMSAFSPVIEAIFGFPIVGPVPARNRYTWAYGLGNGCGFIAFGGNRDTLQIHLTGVGCLMASAGWEYRLWQWCKRVAIDARITRIDLAHDQFENGINPREVYAMWSDGLFKSYGHNPNADFRGDWHGDDPSGKGLTFYVGTKDNGKRLRVYEKGKELGDCFSEWVRFEMEFGNKCRVLPLDMLIFPGRYFAGGYEVLNHFADHPTRIMLEKKSFSASLEGIQETIKHQFGRHLSFLLEIYEDSSEVLMKVMREGLPKAFAHYGGNAGRIVSSSKSVQDFDPLFGSLKDFQNDVPIPIGV